MTTPASPWRDIERLREDLKYERALVRYLQYYRDHIVDHDRALDAAAAKYAKKMEAEEKAPTKQDDDDIAF